MRSSNDGITHYASGHVEPGCRESRATPEALIHGRNIRSCRDHRGSAWLGDSRAELDGPLGGLASNGGHHKDADALRT